MFCETIFRQPNPGQCPGVFFGDADLLNVRYRHVTDNPTAPQETKETRHEAQTSQTESEAPLGGLSCRGRATTRALIFSALYDTAMTRVLTSTKF